MIVKSTKRRIGNTGSKSAQLSPTSPFLTRFLRPPQIGQFDPGKTIYTYVNRETTDDR